MFQSMNILDSFESRVPLRHDYCDDLESFFYVFSYILFAFSSPGKLQRLPKDMDDWDADVPNRSKLAKAFAVNCDADLKLFPHISQWWSSTARSLFVQFQQYIKRLVDFRDKGGALSGPQANAHYDELEDIFQAAIDAATKTANATPPVAGPSANVVATTSKAAASVTAGEATRPKRTTKATGPRKRINSAPAGLAKPPAAKATATAGPSKPNYPRTRAASAHSKRPSQEPDPSDERAPKRQRPMR
jgi:hypothetical protein